MLSHTFQGEITEFFGFDHIALYLRDGSAPCPSDDSLKVRCLRSIPLLLSARVLSANDLRRSHACYTISTDHTRNDRWSSRFTYTTQIDRRAQACSSLLTWWWMDNMQSQHVLQIPLQSCKAITNRRSRF